MVFIAAGFFLTDGLVFLLTGLDLLGFQWISRSAFQDTGLDGFSQEWKVLKRIRWIWMDFLQDLDLLVFLLQRC
jgi:hypothetical protein